MSMYTLHNICYIIYNLVRSHSQLALFKANKKVSSFSYTFSSLSLGECNRKKWKNQEEKERRGKQNESKSNWLQEVHKQEG